jgi:hypothetical protein
MNKELISEINRFREISNLPLLMEAFFPYSMWDEIVKWVGKTADEDIFTFITKPTSDLKSKELLDELNIVAKKVNLEVEQLITKIEKKTLSPTEQDELGAALLRAGNKELQNVVYMAYLKTDPAMQVIENTFKGVKFQEIIDSKDPVAISELKEKLLKITRENEQIGGNVKKYLEDLIESKFPKEKIENPKEKLSKAVKIGGVLSDSFWEVYSYAFDGEITDFISVFKRWTDTFFSNNDEKIKKIKNLNEEITKDINRASEEGGTFVDPKNMRRLTELCFAMKDESTKQIQDIIKNLHSEGKLSTDVYNELRKNDSVLNEWIDKMSKVKKSKQGKTAPGITDALERWSAFKKILDPTYPWRKAYSIMKEGKKGYLTSVLDTYLEQLGRTFWQLFWLDPRLPSEVLAFRNARGTTWYGLVAGKVTSLVVTGQFVIPSILASLNFLYNAFQDTFLETEGENTVLFGETDAKALGMESWDRSDFWWQKYNKWRTLKIADAISPPTEKEWTDNWSNFTFFWTNFDEVYNIWMSLTRGNLTPEEKKQKMDEYRKKLIELEKQGREIQDSTLAKSKEVLSPYKEELNNISDSTEASVKAGTEKVKDVFDDSEDTTDDTEETTTGRELSKSEAMNMGVTDRAYNKWVTNRENATLTKISDDELELYLPKVGYYEVKKIDGAWYFGGDMSEPMDKSTVESKIIKQKNMKTLNESIRKKLTSKYIDKSKKFIKITENLEKVYPFFEEENYDVFFKKMFKLAESFKKSKLYINEADEELFSKGLSLLSGQEDMIKEKLVGYISSALSLTDKMKEYIKNEIDSVPNGELGSLFTSPRKVADMIADAVVDQARDSKPTATDLMTAIEASTIPYFETSEFRRKLVREIQNLIGPKMDEKKGKITQIVRDLLKKSQEN